MRKFLIVLAMGLLLLPSMGLAATLKSSSDQGSLSVGQTEQAKNAYLAGNSINFAGQTAQDLIAAGNTISVIGNVNSSLMAAANNITVSGPVGQSVRVAGSNISVQNTVGSDFVAAGASILVDKNSVIGDDLIVAVGTLDMFGTVNGNAYVAGGQINIDGVINGDLVIKNAESVSLGDNAIIRGKFDYVSAKTAVIAPGAQIMGETKYSPITTTKSDRNMILGFVSVLTLLSLIGTFFVIWLIVFLMPKLLKGYVENSAIKPWEKIGIGFIGLVVTPVAAVLLMITVIGLPLGLLLLGAYVLILGFAKLIVPIFVGSYLFKWLSKDKQFVVNPLSLLVGVIAAFIIGLIPFIGSFVLFLVFLMSLAQIMLGFVSVFKANR